MKMAKIQSIITYHIYYDGRIEKHIPKKIAEEFKQKYKYVYHDEKGNEHEVCIAEWHKVKIWEKGSRKIGDTKTGGIWETRVVDGKTRYYKLGKRESELIKVPFPISYVKNNVIIKLADNTTREYINPLAFASLLGAIAMCGYEDFSFNGSTSKDGTGAPSVTHINGISLDFRYLRKDKLIRSLHINTNPNMLDVERQEKFIDALCLFGYSSFYSYYINLNNKSNFILKNSTHITDHHHHLHIRKEGYNPKYKEIKL
jgi:hypothetical protein